MANPTNRIFIATSIDGYIADRNGGLEWLETIPEINQVDSGYEGFMAETDALVMGRVTFETVLSFGIDWPYTKPVYVLSNTLKAVSAELQGKVSTVSGTLAEVLDHIHAQGHHRLYIDGGSTIQSFLKEDRIDEMIITTIPVLLGGGFPLFGEHEKALRFDLVRSTVYVDQVVQRHYQRKRD